MGIFTAWIVPSCLTKTVLHNLLSKLSTFMIDYLSWQSSKVHRESKRRIAAPFASKTHQNRLGNTG